MRIRCTTRFDITATGVAGNHSRNRLPFHDDAGEDIRDLDQWNRSRNRQRNWETIQQILNLRTLLENITKPVCSDTTDARTWYFEFEIERASSLDVNGDPLGALKVDCQDVPMILGLDESPGTGSSLIYGDNIDFEIITK